MVSVISSFSIKDYIVRKIAESTYATSDKIGISFLFYLGLTQTPFDASQEKLIDKCAIEGFNECNPVDGFENVFSIASEIYGTPMPWVSDMVFLLGLKLLSIKQGKEEEFKKWVSAFLPQKINRGVLDIHDKTLGKYILDDIRSHDELSSDILLFLHFKGLIQLNDQKRPHIESFLKAFNSSYDEEKISLLAVKSFVFDSITKEMAALPPNNWDVSDLIQYLENIPCGLKSWTWEDKSRTKGGEAGKWVIDNEYHVQNLLYILLAPIFPDIQKEVTLPQLGPNEPRADLYIPCIDTLIEVKIRKEKKSITKLFGEVAEDNTLYKAKDPYKNSKIITFLWDHIPAPQDHPSFKKGVLEIGFNACIIISVPSFMK